MLAFVGCAVLAFFGGLCGLAKAGFQTNEAWLLGLSDAWTELLQTGNQAPLKAYYAHTGTFCLNGECLTGKQEISEGRLDSFGGSVSFSCVALEDVVYGEGYISWRWVILLATDNCKEFWIGRSHQLVNESEKITFDIAMADDVIAFNQDFDYVSSPQCANGNGNGNSDSSSD